jgi:hypothetical protein
MNNYRRSLLLGLAILPLALLGCASKPALSRIQDPDVDFHSYHTFAFYGGSTQSYSLVERHLLAAARTQLERRGYAFDDQSPDLLVNIGLAVEERQGLRRLHGAFGSETAETEDYRTGRLAVDLLDARRQDVVWHGVAEGRLSESMMRDAGVAAEKAVAAVFEGFPIKASASPAAITKPTAG